MLPNFDIPSTGIGSLHTSTIEFVTGIALVFMPYPGFGREVVTVSPPPPPSSSSSSSGSDSFAISSLIG